MQLIRCTLIPDSTESMRRGSCDFPFEHNGISFSTCITREDSQLWCKGRESDDQWYACPGERILLINPRVKLYSKGILSGLAVSEAEAFCNVLELWCCRTGFHSYGNRGVLFERSANKIDNNLMMIKKIETQHLYKV